MYDFNNIAPKQISPTKTTIAFGRRTGILETNADTRVSRPRTLSSLNKSDKVKVSTRLNVQSTPVETLKIEPIKRPIEPPSVDYDYVDNEADSVNNIIVRDEIIDYSPEINTAELHVDPEFLADEEVEFNQEFCSSHQEAEESEFPVNTSFEYERILRSRKSSLENNVSLPIDEDSHFKQLQDGIKTFFNKQEETDNDDECSSQDEFETEFKMVDSESLQPAIVDGKVYRPTSKLARFSYTADSIEEKVEDDLIEEDSYDLTRDAHELNEFIRTHSRPFSVEHQEVAQEDVLKDAEDASELERHDTAIALNDDGIGKANLNSKDLGEILAQSLKDLREMGNTLRYEQMEEEDL